MGCQVLVREYIHEKAVLDLGVSGFGTFIELLIFSLEMTAWRARLSDVWAAWSAEPAATNDGDQWLLFDYPA